MYLCLTFIAFQRVTGGEFVVCGGGADNIGRVSERRD